MFQETAKAAAPATRCVQVHGHAAANITVCAVWNWQEHVRHAKWQHCRHSVTNASKGASKYLQECKETMMIDLSLKESDSDLWTNMNCCFVLLLCYTL